MSIVTQRLHNKVAIVTGASSGIGRAIALAFASHGTRLIVCTDIKERPEEFEDQPSTHELICSTHGPGKAIHVRCDIAVDTTDDSTEENLTYAVHEAVRRGGRLDIMVNNAGIFLEGPLHEFSLQSWTQVMTVNSTGVFKGCKAAIKQFLTQSEDLQRERGCVINISSVGALKGLFQCGAYCASKGAILGLTKAIAVEYGARGIRANAICPGYTETAMLRPWLQDAEQLQYFLDAIPSGRLASPKEMTGAAVWLASSVESSYVNGSTITIDAGFHVK